MNKVRVEYEHSLFFMNPTCMRFEVALKRVNNDKSVMEMARLGVKFRVVAVHILMVGDDIDLEKDLTTRVPKLTFKRAPKSTVDIKKQFDACGPENILDSLNEPKYPIS